MDDKAAASWLWGLAKQAEAGWAPPTVPITPADEATTASRNNYSGRGRGGRSGSSSRNSSGSSKWGEWLLDAAAQQLSSWRPGYLVMVVEGLVLGGWARANSPRWWAALQAAQLGQMDRCAA